ncbi:MAG: hypothetical protein K2P51_08215 [Rhabdochlamydiaceae bacterium]|nr:hypothetical protein [Rhabdochlamydiaceae bacterium]
MPVDAVLSKSHSDLFKEMVEGKSAFYLQKDYVEVTRQEMAQEEALPARFTVERQNSVSRFLKTLFSYLVFPVALYRYGHHLAAGILFPLSKCPQHVFASYRKQIPLNTDWKFKRFTFEVPVEGSEPYKIDAMIVGKQSTLGNGRWLVASNGNNESYEQKLVDLNRDFYQILTELKSNAIVFNYPGVGASSGPANRQAMESAYRCILNFLHAKEVIGFGHSMGGGAQAAVKGYPLKPDVKYVFVKSRTFADIASTASLLVHRIAGWAVSFFGWNLDTASGSRNLKGAKEVIIQTASVSKPELLNDRSKMIDDGVIPAKTSLAYAIAGDGPLPPDKVIIGVPEMHNEMLQDTQLLTQQINRLLR